MPNFWELIMIPGGEGPYAGHQGLHMDAYVSHPLPSAGTTFPAIIVVQEAFGVNAHIQKVCDKFAQAGYVAIAPAFFHRSQPNPKLGYGDADVPARNKFMGALKDNEIITDVNYTVDYLQHMYPRTQGQKIGIVGFCVGGRIAYLAATSCPGVSAAVCYYPGRVLIPFGEGNKAPIELTSQIKVPVMGNFGGQDQNPSPADVAKIEAELKKAKATYDFKSYPQAGHGFNCDERSSYNKAAADDAWTRTIGWFDKHVKGSASGRTAAAGRSAGGARRR
ncbi:MAG: dienelactone hydrolase family protein [SAR202 cluster bacterium]|nr:dienelactone hydrolase family protein [SAR202 cluster bacterium]